MSDKSVLEMTCSEAARETISFMDEMDEAVSRGAKTMKAFMEENRVKASLAETGIIILYGDALSNKATDSSKVKVCMTCGDKGTLKVLLQEALSVIENPNR